MTAECPLRAAIDVLQPRLFTADLRVLLIPVSSLYMTPLATEVRFKSIGLALVPSTAVGVTVIVVENILIDGISTLLL